ncbi:Zinc-finger homeodomain protein 2 [Nymphaea thermarum]|nr:Zinc-finger homeodomain protein 2 [Nymphaea thermarum]
MEVAEMGEGRGSQGGGGGGGTVYRECLKNHAASLGSYATDGCGEFMESTGEGDSPGSGGSLRCAACGCHRNFHRKVVAASRDDDLDFRRCCSIIEVAAPESAGRKRFRTKFSAEQKERMLEFAEKIGWRIQKGEEAAIQNFCRENGVSRRVFKVWMHNHKNSSANASSLTQ